MLSFKKYLYFGNNSCIRDLAACSLLLILVLFKGCSTQEQSQKVIEQHSVQIESIGAPKLVVENASYDLGEIVPGSSNTAVFNFRNAGDEPLKITDVKKCCGAVVELDKEELAPGESGVLTVKYRTGQRTRTLSKKVSLFTNDPENPQVELAVMGKVVRTLEWTPSKFEISPYKQDIACPDITIKSLNDTPFSIKGFKATDQCFTADFDPDQKANEFTLQLKTDTDKLTAQNTNRGSIRIELDHPDYKTISLTHFPLS
jgi:hypothetical protein